MSIAAMNAGIGSAGTEAVSAATGAVRKTAEAIEKSAKEFESVFLSQMLNLMFQDVGKDGLGNEENDEVYRSWMTEQYAKLISDHGGIGIAAHVQREMLKLQEIKDSQTGGIQ